MQNSKTIIGIAIIIILLAAGYAFLVGENAQDSAAVDVIPPKKPSQPEQFQLNIPSKDENIPVSRRKDSAVIVRPVQEDSPSDESSLPRGLPPEDAILDPDAEEMVYDPNAPTVNIGEYMDPDSEYSASDAEEEVVNMGEFLDPDADPLTMPLDAEEIPQHIGPFIDVDSAESDGMDQSTPEEVVNIGEHIEPE